MVGVRIYTASKVGWGGLGDIKGSTANYRIEAVEKGGRGKEKREKRTNFMVSRSVANRHSDGKLDSNTYMLYSCAKRQIACIRSPGVPEIVHRPRVLSILLEDHI